MLPVSEMFAGCPEKLDISDINNATIRQCVNVAHELEHISGEKFVHLEFGIPGIAACQIGVDAQKKALDSGYASVYPPACGIQELKDNGARFVKAFTGIDINPEGIVPTTGSMQGCYNLLLECSQLNPDKDTVVYLNPGFRHIMSRPRLSVSRPACSTSMTAGESCSETNWSRCSRTARFARSYIRTPTTRHGYV